MDAVATFCLLQEPDGEIFLIFRHRGGIQIVHSRFLDKPLDGGSFIHRIHLGVPFDAGQNGQSLRLRAGGQLQITAVRRWGVHPLALTPKGRPIADQLGAIEGVFVGIVGIGDIAAGERESILCVAGQKPEVPAAIGVERDIAAHLDIGQRQRKIPLLPIFGRCPIQTGIIVIVPLPQIKGVGEHGGDLKYRGGVGVLGAEGAEVYPVRLSRCELDHSLALGCLIDVGQLAE